MTPSANTFIQFENKSGFPVNIYTSSYSRDNDGTPFVSVGANGTSAAVIYPAGAAEFYVTYLLGIDGIAIPYAPPGEAGYVYGRVTANQTTAIPIPPLSDKLSEQQMASPVTNMVYVKIQNASYSALEFHQGTSPLNTQEDAQKTVNALETKTYLIQSGPAALYSFKRNGVTTLNFPAGMTQFEAGHLYSFLYERGDSVTLVSGKTLSAAEAGALVAPANIQASAVSNSSINLTWSTVPDATVYKVYRTENPYGEFVIRGKTGSTSYTDTGLVEGQTYYYKVSSVKGTEEHLSASYVSAVPHTPTLPAPSGLTAEAASSDSVILSWSAVQGAVVYRVYQGATSGTVNEYVGAAASPIITITGLATGATYYFSVSALDGTNSEGPKAEAIPAIPIVRLAVPSGLAALPQSGSNIRLTWNAVNGAGAYEVFRAVSASGPYTSIGRSAEAMYTDTGLAGGTYYYRLRAWDQTNTGSSALSVYISGTTATSALFAPNVSASATPLGGIVLTWNAINGATLYSIYRSMSAAGPYAAIASISGTSFTDDDVFGGTRYYYKVSATNGAVISADSAAVNAQAVLTAPDGVNAFALSTGSIQVTWNAVLGASGYEVYRAGAASGDYVKITASPVVALSYTDTGLNPATTYYYKVRTVTASGVESALSTQTSAIPSMTGLYDGAIDAAHKIGSQNLTSALSYLSTNAQTGHEYFIVLGANESVSGKTMSYSGKTVGITLMGNGTERIISLGTDTALFIVGTGVTLTLDDNVTFFGRGSNTSSLVSVSGTLVMNEGSKITGNISSSYGGGVYVNGGNFTMNGGTISGNSTSSYYGGGVYVNGGYFTMNGGTISGNSDSYYGGGVYVNAGTFTMDGGTISGNSASYYGGGVYVNAGTFIMRGGTINGNTASSSIGSGGGVYVNSGIFRKISGVDGSNSGIIYGSEASGTDADGVPLKNTANGISSYGGAAAYYDSSPVKKRNTTAGQTDYINTSTGLGLSASGEAPF
jgi:fibronectin type 3 domain-containing protein